MEMKFFFRFLGKDKVLIHIMLGCVCVYTRVYVCVAQPGLSHSHYSRNVLCKAFCDIPTTQEIGERTSRNTTGYCSFGIVQTAV